MHREFKGVYQQLKAARSVQGCADRELAIVWKGYYEGWDNLASWQKLLCVSIMTACSRAGAVALRPSSNSASALNLALLSFPLPSAFATTQAFYSCKVTGN